MKKVYFLDFCDPKSLMEKENSWQHLKREMMLLLL